MSSAALRHDFVLQGLGAWHRVPQESLYANAEPVWPRTSRVPQWHFQHAGSAVSCKTPIEVTLRWEDGLVSAESGQLHIFASGESIDEAMQDFNHQVVHFYNYYTQLHADDVVGLAAQLWKIYRDEFEDVATDVA